MPLFDPDTELDFGDDFDFDQHDPVDGYASAESLGLGFSVGGVQVPFRTVSQLERTEPQSILPESPRHGANPTNTRGRALSPTSQQQQRPSSNNNYYRANNNIMSPAKRNAAAGTKKYLEDDSGSDWNPSPTHQRRKLSKTPSKGGKNSREEDEEEDEEDDLSQEEEGDLEDDSDEEDQDDDEQNEEDNDDGTAAPVEHKDRWESDFGMNRINMTEAVLSFIRDGYSTMLSAKPSCFKPNGGAYINNFKNKGVGTVWVTDEEDRLREGLLWAIGKLKVKKATSKMAPAIQASQAAAKADRNTEITEKIDNDRWEARMDAETMAENRKARLAEVNRLFPDDRSRAAKPAEAQEMVNAIAGKPVNFAQLKAHYTNTDPARYGPLPAALQVDPVLLPPGPQSDEKIEKEVAAYKIRRDKANEIRQAKLTAANKAKKEGKESKEAANQAS